MSAGQGEGTQPVRSAGSPPPIGRLAWRVFAPLDAVINVAINAPIAWWLFGGRDEIPLTGPFGLTMMALPMTFILATATTFFGFWNAVRERRAGRAAPALASDARWLARACAAAVAGGVSAGIVACCSAWVLGRVAPGLRVGPVGAVLAISGYAALLAFWLHGRAVERGGLLRSRRESIAGIGPGY
jgi:hypothetical protein